MKDKQPGPIQHKEEIARHPDNKIDQDFNGYPHGPAKDETIKPQTAEEKETAGIDKKDGEKRTDEQESDGSANAFEGK